MPKLIQTKSLAKSRGKKLGMSAAKLIEAAIQGDEQAQWLLSEIALFAEEGDPAAQESLHILCNVFALGEQKGAWGGPPCGCDEPLGQSPHAHSASVAGWAYNVPYRGIALDAPSVKLRALYAMGVGK